jgi:sugar phosphate isomerase/epimerase
MFEKILDRISYFAVYDDSLPDALRWASENGFTGVQVAVESPHLSFERIGEEEQQQINEFIRSKDVRLILHAHDDAVSLLECNSRLRQGMFKYYDALFSFAENTGAGMITIHLGKITTYPTDSRPEQRAPATDLQHYRKSLRRNLDKLVELAKSRVVLCVENYRLHQFLLDILQPYLDDGRLALCWDVPKMFSPLMRKNEPLEDFFRENIEHVKQVHLHDVRNGRSHRVIGSGEMDFSEYLALFSEYDILDYCIEVRPRAKAKESLENLKKIVSEVPA